MRKLIKLTLAEGSKPIMVNMEQIVCATEVEATAKHDKRTHLILTYGYSFMIQETLNELWVKFPDTVIATFKSA